MNISLLEPLGVPEAVIREYGRALEEAGHSFTYYDRKTTDVEELKRRTAGQDIVMIANNPYPDEVIRSADRLKMIAVAFTGTDHVGKAACQEKNIMICNCAGYSDQTVAELVIGMVLDLYRKIRIADRTVRNGGTSAGLTGREIAGKTVGIVGCGKIGSRTAKLFQAFGAKVLISEREERPEWKEQGFVLTDLDTLMKSSDIVSIHLPLTDATRGFISREKIALMKQDAVLINCARGPIVDNFALAQALQERRIAGAGIDVFDMEPPIPSEYGLLHADNAVLTPHVAFLSEESMVRRAEIEFENVNAYLAGAPRNICRY